MRVRIWQSLFTARRIFPILQVKRAESLRPKTVNEGQSKRAKGGGSFIPFSRSVQSGK